MNNQVAVNSQEELVNILKHAYRLNARYSFGGPLEVEKDGYVFVFLDDEEKGGTAYNWSKPGESAQDREGFSVYKPGQMEDRPLFGWILSQVCTVTHSYFDEVWSLCQRLQTNKWGFYGVDDGEEFAKLSDAFDCAEMILGVDESTLFVLAPSGARKFLFIVLGNEPGVIVNDCSGSDGEGLSEMVDNHYNFWSEGRVS